MFFDLDPLPRDQKRCDLHTIPLDVFLKMPPVPQEHVDKHFLKHQQLFLDKLRYYRHFGEAANPAGDTGYSIQFSPGPGFSDDPRDGCIILTHLASGEVVGGCSSMDFYIDPQHRGKGLGGITLLTAFDEGIKKTVGTGHMLSPDGKRAHMSAHRLAVKRALEEGLEVVPDEVLKDYPDLSAAPAASAPAADHMDEPSF